MLACFKQLSGMKINYVKIDPLTLGMIEEESNKYDRLFYCNIGDLPLKYLGVLLHYNKLKREDVQPVVDKLIKRIDGWTGRLLSSAAKLTLLKSCLTSIPIYLLSVINFPKWPSRTLTLTWPISCGMMLKESIGTYHLSNEQNLAYRKDHGGGGFLTLVS